MVKLNSVKLWEKVFAVLIVIGLVATVMVGAADARKSREKALVKISDLRDSGGGHTYVILQPVLSPSIGAWSEGPLSKAAKGTIQMCQAYEEVVGVAKDPEGNDRPISALFLDCPAGKFRVDTIWFVDPTKPQ